MPAKVHSLMASLEIDPDEAAAFAGSAVPELVVSSPVAQTSIQPTSVKVSTQLSRPLHAKLLTYCEKEGRKMRWAAEQAITEWLERQD